MHLRTVFLILLLIFCSIFLVVNWEGVMAPVTVNLLYTETQAPLGLILLLGPGLLIFVCLIYGFIQQAALAMELRRVHRQLQNAQDLASKAELSRFNDLKKDIDQQIKKLQDKSNEQHAALTTKLTAIEEELESNTRVTIDSISASVGEVEDRLPQLLDWAGGKSVTITEKEKPEMAE